MSVQTKPPDPPWHASAPATITPLTLQGHYTPSFQPISNQFTDDLSLAIQALADACAKTLYNIHLKSVLRELANTVPITAPVSLARKSPPPPTRSRYTFAATFIGNCEGVGPGQWLCHAVSCAPATLSAPSTNSGLLINACPNVYSPAPTCAPTTCSLQPQAPVSPHRYKSPVPPHPLAPDPPFPSYHSPQTADPVKPISLTGTQSAQSKFRPPPAPDPDPAKPIPPTGTQRTLNQFRPPPAPDPDLYWNGVSFFYVLCHLCRCHLTVFT